MNVALIGSLVALLCLWHEVAAVKPEHFGNRSWTLDWSNHCWIAFLLLLLRLLLLLLKGWGQGVWCNTGLLSTCDHVARIKLQQSQEQRYRVLLVRVMFHCAPSALLCYVPCLFNSRRQPKNYSSVVFFNCIEVLNVRGQKHTRPTCFSSSSKVLDAQSSFLPPG